MNYEKILLALISNLPATIAAVGAFIASLVGLIATLRNHKMINSRMSEMLKLNKVAAKSEGNAEGRLEEKKEESGRKRKIGKTED